MKTKVIALILVIPLLLIFTTSTVVKTAETIVNIPVSSVEIEGEKIRFVDISSAGEIKLNATVYPDNAKNKSVTFSKDGVDGQKEASVLLDAKLGTVKPLSTGYVKITANADGGKSDAVTFVFTSDKPIITDLSLKGDGTTLQEGQSINFSDQIENLSPSTHAEFDYSCSDETIAQVSLNGKITALRQGECKIKATFDGLEVSQDGTITEKEFSFDYALKVKMKGDDIMSFGEGLKEKEESLYNGKAELSFDVNAEKLASNKVTVDLTKTKETAGENEIYLSYEVDKISLSDVKIESGRIDFTAQIKSGVFVPEDGLKINVVMKESGNEVTLGTITLTEDDGSIKAKFDDDIAGAVLLKKQATKYAKLQIKGLEKGTYYVVYKSDDESVLRAYSEATDDTVLSIEAKKAGTAHIKTVVYDALTDELVLSSDDASSGIEPLTVEVLNPVKELPIDKEGSKLSVDKNALDSEFALGYYDYVNGSIEKRGDTAIQINGLLYNGDKTTSQQNLEWTTSNNSIATVKDGKLCLTGEGGKVTLTVKNDKETIEKLSKIGLQYDGICATTVINVIKDGVNVYDDDQLYAVAKNENYKIVLQNSISLGDELKTVTNYDTFDYKAYQERYTTLINCTADNTYYKNIGSVDNSKIRCALNLKNDLYGNGYIVDADCLTTLYYVKFNDRIYRGPIDLVRYKVSASDSNLAVKSQDSIIFYIEKDGITVTNVELKGCSDSSLKNDNDNADITKLDYCGTVLEIAGDNVNLSYSRVNNGRTAVRIFGRSNVKSENWNSSTGRTHVTVNNCILSYAREFIMKIGSNVIKKMTPVSGGNYLNKQNYATIAESYWSNASPDLVGSDGTTYHVEDDNLNNQAFYNEFVATDVTIENSVFHAAGLFSIGLDTMFGGLVLNGWDYSENYKFQDWSGVGGTSYPAILRLKGDVRFYDWKDITSVNSDTLLEGKDSQVGKILNFNLDIGSLIDSYTEKTGSKMVSSYDGKKYVNGAIAYFGGGKNYSMVDTTFVNENFTPLNSYSVDISYLAESNTQYLYYTAGKKPFRFMLYDSESKLSVENQIQSIEEEITAYNWVKK